GLLLISHDLAIVRYVADRVNVMYLGRLVEEGPSELVWGSPAHPYTEALISAVPDADGMGVLPNSLPGDVPTPASPPSRCRFNPRCPYAFEGCSPDAPQLADIGSGQAVACWLHSRAPNALNGRSPQTIVGERKPADAAFSRVVPCPTTSVEVKQ